MRALASIFEARRGVFGLSRKRESDDWETIVARHTRDDWPPPAWLQSLGATEGQDPPYDAAIRAA